MTLKDRLIAGIFPRRCPVCDRCITVHELICRSCGSKLKPLSGDSCMRCGKTLRDTDRIYCYDCSRKLHFYDRNFAVFEYADIKKSLYRFKYQGRAEYGAFYAYAAYARLGATLRQLNIQAIVPVPIHLSRRRVRGYNQAEEFGRELSRLSGIPLVTDLVTRSKATIPLKNLSERDRRNNLKRAFTIDRDDVKLKTIVIVDDIYTTGATLDTISALLRESGVHKIYGITVAIGRGL